VVGAYLLYRGRPKRDFGEATAIENLGAIHCFLNLGSLVCGKPRGQNAELARVHKQSDTWTLREFDATLSDGRFNFVIVREGRKQTGLEDANLQHRASDIDRAHLTLGGNTDYARQANC
jgi:hypothetical protein